MELIRLFQQSAMAQQPGMGSRIDSDDPEYQRRLYEAIQRRGVEENLAAAIEQTPEAFARVTMLYVNAEINGHKFAAFCDSGAQMTVCSEQFAEKCNLTRLIDRKYQGEAHGVGTTKIVGRIHMALVKLCGIVMPMSITVLCASNMEFLLGLDQMRRHLMVIDLQANVLRIGGEGNHSAPFLSEGGAPGAFEGRRADACKSCRRFGKRKLHRRWQQ